MTTKMNNVMMLMVVLRIMTGQEGGVQPLMVMVVVMMMMVMLRTRIMALSC